MSTPAGSAFIEDRIRRANREREDRVIAGHSRADDDTVDVVDHLAPEVAEMGLHRGQVGRDVDSLVLIGAADPRPRLE